MSLTETQTLIAPHGGRLVDRTGPRPDGVERLEQVPLTSRELSDLDMLASGALFPHRRRGAPGCGAAVRAEAALPRRSRDGLRAAGAGVPGARARSARNPARVRRARLAARGRLPDAQPDPPCARVPDQGCAR